MLQHYLFPYVERLRSVFAFDVIHAHHLFPVCYVAMRIARGVGVPVVVSAVGSDVHTHPWRNRGIGRRTRIAIRESDRVLAVSRALAGQVRELAEPVRDVRVVYMGVDTEKFAPMPASRELRAGLGLPTEGVGVCSVARLVPAKGVLELLDAFEQATAVHPEVWLAVVGEGPLRDELRSRILARGLERRIFLAGRRPHGEVRDWINAADVFVLASHNEGLPNVVLEAMACGRAVIATDVGGVREAVEDEVAGIVVPSGCVAALAAALERLVRSATLRREMGAAGRVRAQSFSWTRCARELHSVYGEVLELHRSAADAVAA